MTTMEALREVPLPFRTRLRAMVRNPKLSVGVLEMLGREREFDNPLHAILSGLGAWEPSRAFVDEMLDEVWSTAKFGSKIIDEVVIGSGPTAATYATTRSKMGLRVVVLERAARAGGSFAMSKKPSFWLNSRNRPGNISIPGQPGALNVFPAGYVQPSDLGSREYHHNAEIAWATRVNLMMSADVVTSADVMEVNRELDETLSITLRDGRTINARRVIEAVGLSKEIRLRKYSTDTLITFAELMARMDEHFPFRGLKRVAVIGAGDSGKCAIEALCGQGPSQGMSTAHLDYIPQIDWYGQDSITKATFCEKNRGRYAGIGKLIGTRVIANPGKVEPDQIYPGFNCTYVKGIPYDLVIECVGLTRDNYLRDDLSRAYVYGPTGQPRIGQRYGSAEIYIAGPAATISVTAIERASIPEITKIPENSVAMFRYAWRTAMLAQLLGKMPPVAEAQEKKSDDGDIPF